jgi:hypothetical protein
MRSAKITLEPGTFVIIAAKSLKIVLFTNDLILLVVLMSFMLLTKKPKVSKPEFLLVVKRKVFTPTIP